MLNLHLTSQQFVWNRFVKSSQMNEGLLLWNLDFQNYIKWCFKTKWCKILLNNLKVHFITFFCCCLLYCWWPTYSNHSSFCLHVVDYNNRKGVHHVLLHEIFASECMLWDYDIGLVSFISLMLINGVANVALVQYCEAKDLLLML